MALSAQRHHEMVDQYVNQHLPETTIDWGCVYADRYGPARLLLFSCGEQCKNKAPVCERRWEKGLSRVLISNQLVHLSPALIH